MTQTIIRMNPLSHSAFKEFKAHSADAAGFDLVNAGPDVWVKPKQVISVPTGIRVELPNDTFGMVTIRSSLGMKGLIIPNAPGIIDADYRGEIMVLMTSLTRPFLLSEDMRIAQLVPMTKLNPVVHIASRLSTTTRGAGGFGSTGA